MTKNVLDVGNCGFDHANIKSMVEANFDAQVTQANTLHEATTLLSSGDYSLVLVNRVFDQDGDSGFDLLNHVQENQLSIPVMLITNFDDKQQEAIAKGAAACFGKNSLNDAQTLKKIGAALQQEPRV